MLAHLLALGVQAVEVDDAPHTCLSRFLAELARHVRFLLGEACTVVHGVQ